MSATKHLYRIQEVAELLDVPASTLRWWEEVFPMFNPNRLPSGQRRFTKADVDMAGHIKELMYVRGLKTEAAIDVLNKTYRKSRPRGLRKCTTHEEAIALLEEIKVATDDVHTTAKIQAVINYLKSMCNP